MLMVRLQSALLLVAALCCVAQTRTLSNNSSSDGSNNNNNNTDEHIAALVTSSEATATPTGAAAAPAPAAAASAAAATAAFRVATETKQNVLNLEQLSSVAVRQSSSIVQDWSLVCKELCGAGLGGEPCAAFCTADEQIVPRSRTAKDLLMHANKSLICEDLCRLRLGGATCDCPQHDAMLEYECEEKVCRSFCVNGKQTLNGCRPCELALEEDEIISSSGTKATSLSSTSKTTTTTTTRTATTKTRRTSKESKAGAWTAAHGSRVGIAAFADGDAEATPNWSELCKSLCKTGDGGSLCKCDLPAFFFH